MLKLLYQNKAITSFSHKFEKKYFIHIYESVGEEREGIRPSAGFFPTFPIPFSVVAGRCYSWMPVTPPWSAVCIH